MFGKYYVSLNRDLYIKAKEYASRLGYSSLKEFVEHIINKEIEKAEKSDDINDDTINRLKGLGYISE
ncbi:hypothetical protein KAW18_10380 [candidate division WOR-3 bacterium]|nr:hypothetical protein [candidate division WOR-3 bacterium]MCK4527765.1 hypothetical protein [candidate division WOR-3 bacterium]